MVSFGFGNRVFYDARLDVGAGVGPVSIPCSVTKGVSKGGFGVSDNMFYGTCVLLLTKCN